MMRLASKYVIWIVITTIFGLMSEAQFAYYSVKQQNDAKNIALTFDDGPHQILSPRLLDSLKARNAKATFFVMGVKAIIHPNILARMQTEGHEVANHVWDHPVLSKLPFDQVHEQISSTNEAIKKASGQVPKVMRPPYGNTNPKLNKQIATKGIY